MICNKRKCTGCFACYNVCPKNAITMKQDEFGNVFPFIDKKKCVNCLLCKKVCPQLNKNCKYNYPLDVYALYNKNNKRRLESSSGGAASLFYEYVLNNDGVVYGVTSYFDENRFSFVRINDKKNLFLLKGSKYVHCYINDVFRDVKYDLCNNLMVLFIGTPCQVNGLKYYLGHDYDNLFVVDIVCHGVPSQKLFFDEIKRQKIKIDDVKMVSFRDSNTYVLKFFDFDNQLIFSKQADRLAYYKNFLQGNIFRDCCYNCKYARVERVSDITIGDFWGLDKNASIYDNMFDGISLVMVNTAKGEYLFNGIKSKSMFEKRTLNEAIMHNEQLNFPVKVTKKHIIYKDNYVKFGYKKTMNMMLTFKEKIIFFLKDNAFIYNIIKNIKR